MPKSNRYAPVSIGLAAVGFLAGALPALVAAQTWVPPIGIPAPPFGINEQPGAVTLVANAGQMPNTIAAGAVVEVRGNHSDENITCNGTAANPAFIIGGTGVNLTGDWNIGGGYCILHGLKFTGSHGLYLVGHHLAVRNSESIGITNEGPTSAFGSGNGASDVVFYNNKVHDHGNLAASSDQDAHCISISAGTTRAWVVDNETYRCSGDGINLNPYPYNESNRASIKFVYIGRNKSHDNKQTGIWTKMSQDVVVSQNEVWNHRPGNSSYGQCIGFQYGAERAWYLYNIIHDCNVGIGIAGDFGGADGQQTYMVGNVIYNISGNSGNSGVWADAAIQITGGTHHTIVNNTIYGASSGVHATRASTVLVSGNIIANLASGGDHVRLEGPSATANTNLSNASWRGDASCSSCVVGTPGFVNPGVDFRLQPGALAVDRAVLNTVYATFQARYGLSIAFDAAKAARPQGANWDIGAYESGGGSLPQIALANASVTEGNSGTTTATFTATLSPAATSTVTVNYATANGSATAGSDYTALSGTLTFSAGQTSQAIAVVVNGDTVGEPSETFVVNLSAPSGANLLNAQATGTIANDDTVPTLSIGDVSVSEGNSGTKVATFTVTLSAASTSPVSATYATANGTATAGSDYAATGGTVTFPAGSLSQTLNVTLNGDTTVEPNETFTVTLTAPSGATLLDGQATGTLTNDDTAAVPTLSITDAAVTEGNSGTKTLAFTATLSASASSTVTVSYATANGTATAGSDYVAQNGTLTYTTGQTSKTVSVVINGDTTVEPSETFTVNLSGPSGATLADGQGVGTLTNDDSAAVPTLSITDASVTEGNSGTTAANFAVTLSAAASGTVTVGFSTANGTATAGSDFTAQSGTLTFTTGQTSKTITVPVIGDATVETNETFTVTLSAPTGATLADAQGIGTIVNDDTAPPTSGENVVWTSLVGVAANGPSLTKTAATGWGTGGAISTKALTSGNGYVEFTATETNTHRLLGLSNGNSSQNWDDIDFAIYLYTNEVKVYEKGALRGTFTSDATGDRFRVSVEAGVVKYLKNGTVFYSSSGTLTYPLLVDTSFYSQGATVTNAFISGAWAENPNPNPTPTPTPPPSSGEALVWTSVVGASANGGTLTKTASTGWGNAGAVSSKTLPSGLNGFVEFTTTQTSTHRILGLSNGDSNQSWDDVDFGLYLYASGPVQVYEKGVLKGTFGTYASGDKLQVAVESGVVKYKKNGIVLYSSASVPVFPLLVDCSLYSQGATFTSAVLSGAWATGTPPPPSSGTPVVWTSVVGASANGGTLTKTAATAWGNAGAISNKTLTSGNGSVEFTATETNTYRMLGLSNGNSSQNWDDIDFNLYLFNAYLQVYEKGVLKGTFGTYSSGDKLQVAVEGGVVKYKKNGVVFYNSTLAPVFPLLVDTALYSQGATLTSTVVSGTWQ